MSDHLCILTLIEKHVENPWNNMAEDWFCQCCKYKEKCFPQETPEPEDYSELDELPF